MTHRIVSLVPAGTDLVAALGLGERLVGVSHACDHPLAAALPRLTRNRLGAGLSAGQIDAAVSDAAHAGGGLYDVDWEALLALRPTVVITQDVCGVCAVDGREVACRLPGGARLVTLGASDVVGLGKDIMGIAEAVGEAQAGMGLWETIAGRLTALSGSLLSRPRPRVLALEWSEPPYLGGHWVPGLVALAGGVHLLSGPGEVSRRADWAEIAAADPDVIVFMPCGYDLAGARAEALELLARPEVHRLRAVREGRFWVVDANALFSRLGPRVVEAAEVLAGILHLDWALPPESGRAVRLEAPVARVAEHV